MNHVWVVEESLHSDFWRVVDTSIKKRDVNIAIDYYRYNYPKRTYRITKYVPEGKG